jgi:hypothetical protein
MRGQLSLRLPRCLWVLVRLLLVTACFQLSGIAGAVLSAATREDESGCCSDCPIEKSGHECPPSCPSCHCHHAGVASVPPPETEVVALAALGLHVVERAPLEAQAPRQPFLRGLYRPPRPGSLAL